MITPGTIKAISVEYAASHAGAERLDALRGEMRSRLRTRLGVHPVVELVPEGSLARTEFKARRVVDDRDLYRDMVTKGPTR